MLSPTTRAPTRPGTARRRNAKPNAVNRLGICYSRASGPDPPESSLLNMLQRRSASKPRADQQPRPRLNRFPPVHRVIRLHRPDHLVDAAPLECVHRRGLVPVDMTRLRVSLARSSMRPSLNRSCASRSSTSASRSSVSRRNASENRAAGASRQATDIRGQADHMPAPHRCRSPRHGQFRLILGDASRRSSLGNE